MRLGDKYIRAINLLGFEKFVESHGVDYKSILQEVSLPDSVRTDLDALIPFRSYVAVQELSSKKINKPNASLEFVKQSVPDFSYAGPVIMLCRFTKDLGEFLDVSLRYYKFHTNAYTFEVVDGPTPEIATLRLVTDELMIHARQAAEGIIATVIGILRTSVNDQSVSTETIRFQHRKPDDIAMHQDFFGCPVEFEAAHTEIVFKRELLKKKTIAGLRLFRPMMELYIGERIKRISYFDHSMTRIVELAIPSIIGTANCTIETVAEALGQNVKQLQRELAKEGTNFSAILEQVRHRMARQFLEETSVPVNRIAGLLDYSSTAPFTTAFHRWTGMSPLKYRQQRQKADPSDEEEK